MGLGQAQQLQFRQGAQKLPRGQAGGLLQLGHGLGRIRQGCQHCRLGLGQRREAGVRQNRDGGLLLCPPRPGRRQRDDFPPAGKAVLELLQDFLPALYGLGAVLQQVPAAGKGGVPLGAGPDEHVPVLVLGVGSVHHRAAFPGGLEQQHPAGQAGYQPVAHLERAKARRLLGEVFRQQSAALLQDALPQKVVFAEIGAVQRHGQHADHRAPAAYGAQSHRGIHAHRPAGDDGSASQGQLVAKLPGFLLGLRRGLAGAHHGKGRAAVHVGQLPLSIQYRGRVVNMRQRLGILPTRRGEHLPAHF